MPSQTTSLLPRSVRAVGHPVSAPEAPFVPHVGKKLQTVYGGCMALDWHTATDLLGCRGNRHYYARTSACRGQERRTLMSEAMLQALRDVVGVTRVYTDHD